MRRASRARSVTVRAVFERFTERAIKSIMLAQQEAKKLGCVQVSALAGPLAHSNPQTGARERGGPGRGGPPAQISPGGSNGTPPFPKSAPRGSPPGDSERAPALVPRERSRGRRGEAFAQRVAVHL